jgi:hypothetical protein
MLCPLSFQEYWALLGLCILYGVSPFFNTPDSFLNEPTRLSGLAVQKLSYFFKVSMSPDFEKKISTTAG